LAVYAADTVDLQNLIALDEEFLAASEDLGASAPVAPSESSLAPKPTLTPLTAVDPIAVASPTKPLMPLASEEEDEASDEDEDVAPMKKAKAKAELVPFKTQTRRQLGAEAKALAPFISPAIPKAKAGAKAVKKATKHVTIEDLEEEEEEEEEIEQGPYDPLYSNNWVELFNSSPLARVPTDLEKVEGLLQPGRKFDKKGNELKMENPAQLQMGKARPVSPFGLARNLC
jgi:hypothetical protein